MLTITKITKLIALATIVVAMNGTADSSETYEKSVLSARHAQLTDLEYKFRQLHRQACQNYSDFVEIHKVAKWSGEYELANRAAQNANSSVRDMQILTQEINRVRQMIQLVERQLVAISRTPTGGNVVIDLNNQPIDQSWWMGGGTGSSGNYTGGNPRTKTNRPTHGLLNITTGEVKL